MLTPLALSLVEKYVSVQTHKQKKHKQTVNDISTPCLSACVDKYKRDNTELINDDKLPNVVEKRSTVYIYFTKNAKLNFKFNVTTS